MNVIVKNIPNILSSTRIVLTPFIFYLIFHFSLATYILLLILYTSTVLLDFLDGYIARVFSLESELGKILDPLADKLLVSVVIIALLLKTDFPLWLAILIISRDLFILTVSFILFQGKKKIKSSVLIGKVTFGILSLLTYLYIIDLNPDFDLQLIKRFFIVTSMTFLFWSWGVYFKVFQKEFKKKKSTYE